MSLDVSLRWEEIEKICHHCKSKYKSHDCVYSSGITHNLWVMADACWIYKALWTPEEVGCKLAKDIIPLLKKWLIKLKKSPEKYMKYSSERWWWGTYEKFVSFVENYLNACMEYPEATIEVSRYTITP